MKNYEKPVVVDFGGLKAITEAALTGQYYDCNARPGFPINPLDEGSVQNPTCP
jgi:hypothetical protein